MPMIKELAERARASPYHPAISHRVLRPLLPGVMLSALGDGMSVVAISWLALSLASAGTRGLWVGAAVAAYSLPGAVGAVVLRKRMRGRASARLAFANAVVRAVSLGAVGAKFAAHRGIAAGYGAGRPARGGPRRSGHDARFIAWYRGSGRDRSLEVPAGSEGPESVRQRLLKSPCDKLGDMSKGMSRGIAQAIARRERGRYRLNVTTAAVGFASVVAAGAVAVALPGSTHASTSSQSGSSSKASTSNSSSSNSDNGNANLNTGSSSSGSSSSGSSSSGSSNSGSSSSGSSSSSSGFGSAQQPGYGGGGGQSTSGGS
jgi:hypothetical protein